MSFENNTESLPTSNTAEQASISQNNAAKEKASVARIWTDALKPRDNKPESLKVNPVEEQKVVEVPKSPTAEKEKTSVTKIWTEAVKPRDVKEKSEKNADSENAEDAAIIMSSPDMEELSTSLDKTKDLEIVKVAEKVVVKEEPTIISEAPKAKEIPKEIPVTKSTEIQIPKAKEELATKVVEEPPMPKVNVAPITKVEQLSVSAEPQLLKGKSEPMPKVKDEPKLNTKAELASKVKEETLPKAIEAPIQIIKEESKPKINDTSLFSSSTTESSKLKETPTPTTVNIELEHHSRPQEELKSNDSPILVEDAVVDEADTENIAPQFEDMRLDSNSNTTEVDEMAEDVDLNINAETTEHEFEEQYIDDNDDSMPIDLAVETTRRSPTSKPSIYPRPLSPKHGSTKPAKSPRSVLKDDYHVKIAAPVAAPSQRLLRTTAARVRDQSILETRKKDKVLEVTPPKKKVDNYTPSSRLLTTTQCRVSDVKEWEAHKERAKYENDIWWEARKPGATAKQNPSTPSKLLATTTAYDSAKRAKHDPHKVDSPPAVPSERVKINEKSPLLKPTTALHYNTWKVEPPKPEFPSLVLEAHSTGPAVQSKVNYETAAFQHAQWKNRQQKEDEIQARPISPGGRKISEVSPRLLDLNKNLKAAARAKVLKVDDDPRESGWRKSFAKSQIPEVDLSVLPQKRSTIRQTTFSPGGTIYSEESHVDSQEGGATGEELQYNEDEPLPVEAIAEEELQQALVE